MSYQRGIFAFVLLATVSLAVIDLATAKDVVIGSHKPGDYIIHTEPVQKASKWLQVVEADRTFSSTQGLNITVVELLDQNKKGNGATASVTAGGPGFTFVTVHFKSKRGHSIDFIAKLHGRSY